MRVAIEEEQVDIEVLAAVMEAVSDLDLEDQVGTEDLVQAGTEDLVQADIEAQEVLAAQDLAAKEKSQSERKMEAFSKISMT